jgi:hypothetical protein
MSTVATEDERHLLHEHVLREYVGLIWVGDGPGVRFSLVAASPAEALAAVDERFGSGHVVSLWNEQDAGRLR